MTVHFDLLSVITALGIAQGFFLSFALLGLKSGNRSANRVLSLTVFLISASIGHGILTYTNLYYQLPHLILIGHPVSYMFGPLLLIYFNFLTNKSYRFDKRTFATFLPFCISLFTLMPFYLKSGVEKLALLASFLANGELYLPSQVIGILAIPHMIIYLAIIWKKVTVHKKLIRESYSHTAEVNLQWIHYFIILYSVSFLLMIPATVLRLSGNLNLQFERIIPLIAALSMYYFGYMGFQQQSIDEPLPDKEIQRKSSTSPLPPAAVEDYKQKLLYLLETDKIYRDPELTLTDLSRELEISRNQLSHVINSEFNMNFFSLINSYRIAEIKELILQQAETPLLNLAMDAGFNSKATFNSVFKKMTGTTPSHFKKVNVNRN